MNLSLVIPCYNESANLPRLVSRCKELCQAPAIEVVLVDNGSTDDTPAVMARLLDGQQAVRAIRVPVNQGYGHGILEGLRAARGDILGLTHADLQTDPMDVLVAARLYKDSPSPQSLFVKGRRYGRPPADVAFTAGMAVFESLLLRARFVDINAQPTLFPRSFFETWKNPPQDFSLDLFAYYQAQRAGLTVQRIPVHFGKRAHGVSNWNVGWAGKWRFIKRTVSYSLKLRRELSSS